MYTLKLTDELMAALRFIVIHEGDALIEDGIAQYPARGAHERVLVRRMVADAKPDQDEEKCTR